VLGQQYGAISGKMTITVKRPGVHFATSHENFWKIRTGFFVRKCIVKYRNEGCQDKDALNNLFTELIKRRDQIARNAGFANFRDYKFVEMGRFDYTKEDCYRFHDQ